MSHAFSYKGFRLGMSFSAQWGGRTYSMTHFALAYQGKLKNSLKGRYAGMIVPGVNLNENGTYSKNTTITTDIVDHYTNYVYARENAEENVFDTSFLKLKELRLEYSLPRHLCTKTRVFQGITIASTPPTSSAGRTSRSTTPKRVTPWDRPFRAVSKPVPTR